MKRGQFINRFANSSSSIDMDRMESLLKRSIELGNEAMKQPEHGSMNMIIAMEELSELQKEISKYLRGQGDTIALIEEIADVTIMLKYIKMVVNIDDNDINKAINVKLDRLEKIDNDLCAKNQDKLCDLVYPKPNEDMINYRYYDPAPGYYLYQNENVYIRAFTKLLNKPYGDIYSEFSNNEYISPYISDAWKIYVERDPNLMYLRLSSYQYEYRNLPSMRAIINIIKDHGIRCIFINETNATYFENDTIYDKFPSISRNIHEAFKNADTCEINCTMTADQYNKYIEQPVIYIVGYNKDISKILDLDKLKYLR